MSHPIVNIITYGLGLLFSILIFSKTNLFRSFFYGIITHISTSTLFAFAISTTLGPGFLVPFVFSLSFITSLWLFYFSHKTNFKLVTKENHNIFLSVLIFFLIFCFIINVVSYSKNGLFIPVVGNNDDTATHLSMAVMTIKDKVLLFKSPLLQNLISRGLDYQNAKYYPPSVYTYIALIYSSITPQTHPLNLPLLLNIYGAFSFLIYLIFIFFVVELTFRMLRSINIWSFTVFIVFFTFFVFGEYFMVLYRMSYLTQLLGTSYLLAFICLLSENNKEKSLRNQFFTHTISGFMLVGIGYTYYLFLPIALVTLSQYLFSNDSVMSFQTLFFIRKSFTFKNYKHLLFWLFWFCVSLVPLLNYSLSYSLIEQITIPGINLITLATLIQFCLMVILFVYLRKYFSESSYSLSLTAFLTSLFLATLTTAPSILKGGELPYYFFKSFFTSAVLATTFGAASLILTVSHIHRKMHNLGDFWRITTHIVIFVIMPLSLVAYLYAYNTLIPGYKGVTYLAGGAFNYYTPQITNKLTSLYETNYAKKPEVYNPGYWGENILLYSLFENIPQIHIEATKKRIFYFSDNPNFFLNDMVKKYKTGKEVLMFDGHGSFKPKR